MLAVLQALLPEQVLLLARYLLKWLEFHEGKLAPLLPAYPVKSHTAGFLQIYYPLPCMLFAAACTHPYSLWCAMPDSLLIELLCTWQPGSDRHHLYVVACPHVMQGAD